MAKYLKRLAEEGGKKLDKKESRFRLHLIPFFRDTSLLRVSSFQVERYKKSRVDAGVKEGTVNRELAALSHLFTKAEEWGWIDKRPAKIKRFTEGRGRISYLTVDQIRRLIEVAK